MSAEELSDAALPDDGAELRPGAGLGQRAARAAGHVAWTQGLRAMLQFASLVVLARLLSDTDYGVIGMVNAVIGVAMIFQDFGLSTAAIQGKDLTRAQRSNLWWVNTGVSAVLTLVIIAISPLLAWFYHEPAVAPVCLAIAPTYLLGGMTVQYRADLTRKLRVGALLVVDLVAAAVALVLGCWAAWAGWGYWALVVQRVVSVVVVIGVLPLLCGWLPRWYDRAAPMRGLLGFGGQVGLTSLIFYLASNLDSIILGRMFGASALGLYNRSVQLIRTPLNLFRPQASNLGLSVLSKIDDDERTLAYLRRGQIGLGYLVFMLAGVVVATAPQIVRIVLGERWLAVVPFLRLVVLGEALSTLALVGGWIYTSRALGKGYLRYTVFAAIVRIAGVLLGAQFGVIGVAWAYVVVPAILWPISLRWAGRAGGLKVNSLVWNGLRIVAVCATAGAASWALCARLAALPDIAVVIVACALMIGVVAILAFVWRAVRNDVRDLLTMLAMMLGRVRA